MDPSPRLGRLAALLAIGTGFGVAGLLGHVDRPAPPPTPIWERAALAAPQAPATPQTSTAPAAPAAGTTLGPLDVGGLHIDRVTIGTETTRARRKVTVVRLSGVRGALGPVQVVAATGEARLPAGTTAGRAALSGTLEVQGVRTGFRADLPVALAGGKVTIGPKAVVHLTLGTGVRIDLTAALALAPPPGGELVVADARVTYGTLTVPVHATVTARPAGGGLVARLALAKPLALDDGITVDRAVITSDGTTVGLSGTAHLGTVLRVDVDGTLRAGTAGRAPAYALTTRTDLALTGSATRFSAGLSLRGAVGGRVAIAGEVAVGPDRYAVAGTAVVDRGGLHLRLTGGREAAGTALAATVDPHGAVDLDLDVDRFAVGGLTVTGAHLDATSTAQGQVGLGIRGTLAWRGARVAVRGSLVVPPTGPITGDLTAEGTLPVADGVTLTGARLHVGPDGITVGAKAHLLRGAVEASADAVGTLVPGAQPTVDLTTDARATVSLAGQRLVLTGGVHIRSERGGQPRIDGRVAVLGRTYGVTGTLGLDGDTVVAHLRGALDAPPDLTIDLTYEPTSRTVAGHLRTASLAIGTLAVRHADLTVSASPTRTTLGLAGAASLGPAVNVDLHGGVIVSGPTTTVTFDGTADLLGRFTKVGVAGSVVVDHRETRFDVTTSAAAKLDLAAKGDLRLDGRLRLRGSLYGPLTIEGRLNAIDDLVPFSATAEASNGPGGFDLHLAGAAGGPTVDGTLHVGPAGTTAHLELDHGHLDAIRVERLVLDASVGRDGALAATLGGTAQLADPSGRLAGVTDARARLSGTYRRSAAGQESLSARGTIDRLRTAGTGPVAGLGMDYGQVTVDLSRVAAGQPITVNATARLAATRQADGTTVLQPDGTPAADGSIALTGALTFTDRGTIGAWKLGAQVDRLRRGGMVLSGRLDASGSGLDKPAQLRLDAQVGAPGATVTGHVAGTVGVRNDALAMDLKGHLDLTAAGGVRASADVRSTGDQAFAFTGAAGYGPLAGAAHGRIDVGSLASGAPLPRIEATIDSWHAGSGQLIDEWWLRDSNEALAHVQLSNWADPGTFRLTADAVGTAGGDLFPGVLFGNALGRADAGAKLRADGTLRLVGGKPGYDLRVRADAAARAQVLGFLWLNGDGAGSITVTGDFHHASARANALLTAGGGVGPLPVLDGGAGLDLRFEADLDAQTAVLDGTAHAGLSLLGPVVQAHGDARVHGTIDWGAKRATLHADGAASGSVLWVVARGSASGHIDATVDFSGGDPIWSGGGAVGFDAHVLFWPVAGMQASLRYDGHALWVTDGWRYLYGDGFFVETRNAVHLRGQLWPTEHLCGDQEVTGRFGGKWIESTWGSCTGMNVATGRVRTDADRDGKVDDADPGLGVVTVQLLGPDGRLRAQTTTGSNGVFRFERLDEWTTYTVVIVPPPGRRFVADPDPTIDGRKSFSSGRGQLTELGSWLVNAPAP
jgi:hypothetical protein